MKFIQRLGACKSKAVDVDFLHFLREFKEASLALSDRAYTEVKLVRLRLELHRPSCKLILSVEISLLLDSFKPTIIRKLALNSGSLERFEISLILFFQKLRFVPGELVSCQ